MSPPMDDLQDNELLSRIAQEDKDAFDALLVRHYPKAYKYLMRLTGNEKDVEDLLQEGFMAIWLKADTFKPDAPFNPWFYSIFYHLFIDYTRAKKHELPLTLDPSNEEDLEEDTSMLEQQLILKAHTNRLPEKERTAFVLFYYEHCQIKEISQIMKTTEQAVESMLYRSRKKLKSMLKGH